MINYNWSAIVSLGIQTTNLFIPEGSRNEPQRHKGTKDEGSTMKEDAIKSGV
ncbi:MAG: hypothetical protein ACRCT1_18670 [Microcoleaceae cyanobacterium]